MVKNISVLEQLKLDGEAREWLTEEGYATLSRGYLLPGETPVQMYHRVANSASSYLPAHLQDEYRAKFFQIIADNWLCLSTPISSNAGTAKGLPISCFNSHVSDNLYSIYNTNTEIAMLSKLGGGTSSYIGDLRGRGAKIAHGGVSSGVLGWVETYRLTVDKVRQSSSNRRGQHATYLPVDHPDFPEIMAMRKNLDGIQIGAIIDNVFIQKLENGDAEAISLWHQLLKSRMETAEPYLFFKDKINAQNPDCYKDQDFVVNSSNLCFSGDTLVAVADGRNAVSIKQLAEESQGEIKFPVYSATLAETAEYSGKRVDASQSAWHMRIQNAIAFKTGTSQLIKVSLADGTSFRCTPEHLIATAAGAWVEAQNSLNEELERFFSESVEDSCQRISGLSISEGQQFAEMRKLWKENSDEAIPLARKGNRVIAIVQDSEEDVYDLTVEHDANFYIVTQCESGKSSGVLVHNCSEITLRSDEHHSFVCCISSMNLARWNEWKDTDAVFTTTVFLDCIMEEFIQKGRNIPGIERAIRFAIASRAIGIGALGYHTYLLTNSIPFESMEAKLFNGTAFKHIHEKSLEATQWMAKELGEPEWCKGYGIRNTHRTAVAPTLSNALISGGLSQGIEPLVGFTMTQKTAKGTFIRQNAQLKTLLETKGQNTEAVWEQISIAQGSVQGLDFLTEHEKSVFKTAYEIDQREIVNQADSRQRWICQSQSLNLFFTHDESPQYIHEVHKLAMLSPRVKTLYYCRSEAVQRADRSEHCVACE